MTTTRSAARDDPAAWIGRARPDLGDCTLHGVLAVHAATRPDALAISAGGEQLTFAALDEQATAAAKDMRRSGVAAGEIVAIVGERSSPRLIVALLAILKSGAAYMLTDPDWPAGRAAELAARFGARPPATAAQLLDAAVGRAAPSLPEVDGGDPCCVITTSGSTGPPKGVLIPHRGVARALLAPTDLGFDQRTVLLQHAPFPWDGFTLELWGALLNGGCCVLGAERHITPAVVRRSVADGVNTLFATPMLFNTLVDEDLECFAGLRSVIVGGDRPSLPHMRRLLGRYAEIELVNAYGPAEASVIATVHRLARAQLEAGAEDVPMGGAIANTSVWLVDPQSPPTKARWTPVGDVGEVLISGEGLAVRYLGASDADAHRFAEVDLPGVGRVRIYRTGDLARRRPDGTLVFVGRADRQVKIRGQRVEPAEVEDALAEQPSVSSAAVVPAFGEDGRAVGLAAYVCGAGGRDPDVSALRAALGERLPAGTVPSRWKVLEELPTGPTGKVDYRALAELTSQAVAKARTRGSGEQTALSSPSADPMCDLVQRTFATVLELAALDPDDDLLAAGGDSLGAMRIAIRLWRATGTELPVHELLALGTPRKIAAALTAAEPHAGTAPGPERDAAVLPYAASACQELFWLADELGAATAGNACTVVVELDGELRPDTLAAAFEQFVARHEVLRTVYAMAARQLIQQAATVGGPVLTSVAAGGTAGEQVSKTVGRLDIAEGPPLAATLAQCDGRFRLVVAVHHIATDAWSEELMFRDLSALYASAVEGTEPALPTAAPYVRYAQWERDYLASIKGRDELDYWQTRLTGVESLPWAGARASDGPVAEADIDLSDLVVPLERLAARWSTTLFVLVAACYAGALRDAGAEQDFAVGTSMARRSHPAFQATMGCFVNSVALRVPRGPRRLDEMVPAMTSVVRDAMAHQTVPFGSVVAAVDPVSRFSHPIFQAFLLLQRETVDALRLPSVHSRLLERPGPGGTEFDVMLDLRQAARSAGRSLAGVLRYRPHAVPPSVAEKIARRVRHHAETAVTPHG
jgi:mycobactin peptide synthetase MbtE